MALFGKKEEAPKMDDKAGTVPVDLVLQMRQQGMNNNQIIQNLQQQGFKSHQIFDAMNQADVKGNSPNMGQISPEELGQPAPVGRTAMLEPSQAPPPPPPPPTGSPGMQDSGVNEERIEEIAESIIEEKWTELIRNVNKIVEWKDRTETRVSRIEDNMKHLKTSFDELHRGVLGKINDYEQSISDVGSDLKALEKVFQKVLPTLTENVNELSRITGTIKKKR